jgi:hypothetical protein
MKGKYITNQILIACLARPAAPKKSIYEQLAETIAERKTILVKYFTAINGQPVIKKDIHEQLRETLAERRRIMEKLNASMKPAHTMSMATTGKQAA